MSLGNTTFGAEKIEKLLLGKKSIFFIGIGGVGMASLARITAGMGLKAGGSDRTKTDLTRRLSSSGIQVFDSHVAEHLAGYDAVVYTLAISEENPEYLAAKAQNLPVISRADYLGYVMKKYQNRIGIAGMHGKSTCTAMCAQILTERGDPTVLCGAELPQFGGETCRVGAKTEQILFEACEYKDSFLDFLPTVALVLNVGLDHVDYFQDLEAVKRSFLKYAQKVSDGGVLIWNADDQSSADTFAGYHGKSVTFGVLGQADYRAENVKCGCRQIAFDFCRGEEILCRLTVPVNGTHNVYNALAAATAATVVGYTPEEIRRGLAKFQGVKRRMEFIGKLNGADVYEDYGHHPDEIKATLAGVKDLGGRRILVAFQPHTYSRTAGLFEGFVSSFGDADRVFLADIYAARETNVWGVTSKRLAEKIGEKAEYCGSFEKTAKTILKETKEGDVLLLLGAGDISQIKKNLPLQ